MSTPPAPRPAPPRAAPTDQRRAILGVLGAGALFAVAAAAVKALGGALPVAEVVLFRNLFAMPVLLTLALRHGGVRAFRTRDPLAHAGRCLWGLLGMWGAFAGYAALPLATVTALGFTMPLFLTALSVPLLGERVGPRRLLALGVGFAGVLLMLRPGAEMAAPDPFAVGLVLAGAFGWAMAMISIRRMGARGEGSVTIVLWFAVGAALVAGLLAIPGWVWPTGREWGLLAAIGLVSAGAQLLMTGAYRAADTTLLAPFEYSAILWTTALGVVAWAEVPDGWDLAGIAVLVGSGLYVWHREAVARGG